MRIVDPMLLEFDRECATTRKVLTRVPEDKLGWKPHERSMTLGQLAWHVASIPGWVGATVLLPGFDLAQGGMPAAPQTAAEMVAFFDQAVASCKEALAQLDNEKAMAEWTLSKGGQAIVTFPRVAYVRNILMNHSVHHRGQLSVYLRLLDVPVPSIYGPSADDNPFA